MKLLLIALIILIINIPFGYWRANVKRFSLPWALAIHIPVAITIAIRLLSNVGFEFYTYLIFVSAFISGQLLGKYLCVHFQEKGLLCQSGCLIMDIYHQLQQKN